jgi:DNA modification methylase
MERNKIYTIDYQKGYSLLADNSIDMIFTSPPYWQARAYGGESTIGFESSPEEYIDNLTPFLEESFRVLKPTGALWLNISDARSQGKHRQRGRRDTDERGGDTFRGWNDWDGDTQVVEVNVSAPRKCFIGIPERAMFRALEVGFTVRNKIVWAKGMMDYKGDSHGGTTPAPHKDNFLAVWEPVFYLTKSDLNYFNMPDSQIPAVSKDGMKSPYNVWLVPPQAGRKRFDYHKRVNFASHPPPLSDIIVTAGCPPYCCTKCDKPVPMLPDYSAFDNCEHIEIDPEFMSYEERMERCYRGVVLDPFGGSGTTAISAINCDVDFILFDISEEQNDYARARIKDYLEN